MKKLFAACLVLSACGTSSGGLVGAQENGASYKTQIKSVHDGAFAIEGVKYYGPIDSFITVKDQNPDVDCIRGEIRLFIYIDGTGGNYNTRYYRC